MSGLILRKMNFLELDLAIEWAAREGWNPGLHDAGCFYSADPNGFFIGILNGEPVGCISAVAYDDNFGFIGFFIVRPDMRGHSVGLELGHVATAYLGKRNIGLDGVENKVKNYQSYGFKPAYKNIRFKGVAKAAPPVRGIVKASTLPLSEICVYDRNFFPAHRERFLSEWLRQPGATALAALSAQEKLCGYGLVRPCREGFKIGPLFAEDLDTARRLLASLSSCLPHGASFFLDIPSVNADAELLVSEYKMSPVFRTMRMYSQAPPDLPLGKIYGITSFELG
ncbi:MAG: GNAT family N-acetyltransferase [Lentisphaerae bacterium GWF2_52_8]|nr:MAG: GNAT family N-acetyltransferase [Lentisphaerae bacterium GWF2_52_8]